MNIAPVSTRHLTSSGDPSPRGLATRTGYVNVLIDGDCSIRIAPTRVSGRIHRPFAAGIVLDVLGTEYVKLARIKGLPERQVIWKHVVLYAYLNPKIRYSS